MTHLLFYDDFYFINITFYLINLTFYNIMILNSNLINHLVCQFQIYCYHSFHHNCDLPKYVAEMGLHIKEPPRDEDFSSMKYCSSQKRWKLLYWSLIGDGIQNKFHCFCLALCFLMHLNSCFNNMCMCTHACMLHH